MPKVLVTTGPSRGAVFALADGATVGRAWNNPIQIMDEQISRVHARFSQSAKGFAVEDLGSRNGIIVNGERVDRAVLKPADEIQIGDTVLVYEPDFDLKVDPGADATVVLYPPDPKAASSVIRKTLDAARPEAVTEPADSTLDALKNAHRRLKAVYDLGRATGAAAEMRELLNAVLHAALSALGRGAAMVLLAADGAEALEPVASRSLGKEKKEIPVSKTLVGMVTRDLKGILSSDAIKDPRFAKSHSITLHGIRSVMCAPLTARGRAIGVLLVQSTESVAAFDEEDLKLLVAIGAQSGPAIEGLRTLNGLRRENANLRTVLRGGMEIVGASPSLQAALGLAHRIADSTATVLVQGETGTGKELFAALIHEKSPRRDMPFVCVNCSAMPESLLESELFGYERGAFTGAEKAKPGIFETAQGGTLFLDEIGEVSAMTQVKLLRAIEQRSFYRVGAVKPTSVDVRFICATSKDLEAAVREKKFREDLYYRITVVPIRLPPLRDRKADIPLLARHFLKVFAAKLGKPAPEIGHEVLDLLTGYPWPGNVRELQNVMERAVILCDARRIETAHLPQSMGGEGAGKVKGHASASAVLTDADLPLAEKVARLEKDCVQKALREAGGRKAEAARLLHISRPTLDKKIKDFSLSSE
jgi:Nif-specific regulatory protein